MTVRSAAELAVPLLVVVTVKAVVPVTVGVKVKSTWTELPTAMVQLAGRVTVNVSPLVTTVPALNRQGPTLSINWTPVTLAPRVALAVTVMVLAVVNAEVAVKKSSSDSGARAVVVVGEIVTLLTEPVSEPIV